MPVANGKPDCKSLHLKTFTGSSVITFVNMFKKLVAFYLFFTSVSICVSLNINTAGVNCSASARISPNLVVFCKKCKMGYEVNNPDLGSVQRKSSPMGCLFTALQEYGLA